jgi:hypothetical protein
LTTNIRYDLFGRQLQVRHQLEVDFLRLEKSAARSPPRSPETGMEALSESNIQRGFLLYSDVSGKQ